MADCPNLEYVSRGLFSWGAHRCKVTGVVMEINDPKYKHLCSVDYNYEYEKCPIYQDSK